MAMKTTRRAAKPSSGRRQHPGITAAAESLQQRRELSGGAGGQIGEPRQREVWDLFDTVPELRTACRITARTMRQCRLVLARVNEKGEPSPIPEDEDHPAKAMLAAFAGGLDGQADLLDQFGVLLTSVGEGIMVGALDQADRDMADDTTRMHVYSPEQVKTSGGGYALRLDENARSDRPLRLSTEPVEPNEDGTISDDGLVAIRVWRPHPRYSWKADSAAMSALGVLQEIRGYDDHIRASLLSRLAGAGLLLIPDGLTLPGIEAAEEPGEEDSIDPFTAYLMEVMSLAIGDRTAAAALVPIFIRGDKEELAALRHITFSTPFDDKVSEYRRDAVGRFGVAVDMPGEILTGYGALQSWTGALITEDYKTGYLAELMSFICGSITRGWFYPAMVAAGHGQMESDVIIWYDDSSVQTRDTTAADAQGAYDRGEITGDAYRRALTYDEGDKPDDKEFAQQAVKILLFKNPALAPLLLPMMGIHPTEEQLDEAKKINAITGAPPAPEAAPVGGSAKYGAMTQPSTAQPAAQRPGSSGGSQPRRTGPTPAPTPATANGAGPAGTGRPGR